MSEQISVSIELVDRMTKQMDRIERNTVGATKKMKSSFGGLSGAIKGVAGAFAGLAVASKAMAFAKESIELAKRQVQAEQALKAAIGGTSEALLNHASALQKVTTFGDEAIIEAQALVAAFVKEEEQIKRLTPAILDLAAAKNMDLRAAADIVTKSVASSTNALSRYGIQVEGAAGSTERIESAIQNVTKAYGGFAEALAKTDVGKIQQVENALGDIKETMGNELIPLQLQFNQLLLESKAFQGMVAGLRLFMGAARSILKQWEILVNYAFIELPAKAASGFFEELSMVVTRLKSAMIDISKIPGIGGAAKAAIGPLNDLDNKILSIATNMNTRWGSAREETEKLKKELVEIGEAMFGINQESSKDVAKVTGGTTKKTGGSGGGSAATGSGMLSMDMVSSIMEERLKKEQDFQANLVNIKREGLLSWLEEEMGWLQEHQAERLRLEEEHARFVETVQYQSIDTAQQVASSIIQIVQNRNNAELRMQRSRIMKSNKSEQQKQSEIEKLEREAFERQKKRAMLEVFINGLAAAIRAWVNPGYPGAIPLTIAIGAQQTASMAAIASQKFADGGIVSGPTTGDNVPVMANGGEMFLNANQQRNLFSMIENGVPSGGNQVTELNVTINGGGSAVDNARQFEQMYKRLKFKGQI